MKKSAGILFLYQNKALLCHPSKAKWTNTFGPPKGGIEKGETPMQAAIRECREEASLSIDPSLIDPTRQVTVNYTTKKGKTFKKVILYIVEINNLSQIGLESEVIPMEKLQHEEVDWCGFIGRDELNEKAFWRFKEVLYAHLT